MVLKNDKVTVIERTEVFGEEKSKLFPTDIGSIVNDFLVANFPKVLDYQFTADVEREFDDIAQGKLEWRDMMAKFYAPFHATVTDTLKNSEKASGERKLGLDDKGLEITVRMAKFGAVIQRTNPADADAKPEYAKVPPGKSIENITLEEALEGFKLPRFIGDYKDEKMVGGLGQFGPYIKYGNLFVSIPKEMNVLEITSDEAIVLVQEKIEKEANKYIKKFDQEGRDDVAVLNGRWGPYIAIGKNNVKIPKGTDPASLTLVEILDLAEKSEKAPSKRTTRKTTKK